MFSSTELPKLTPPPPGVTVVAIPMYCDVNLFPPRASDRLTRGNERVETAIGPRNVRGTTPGNSRWSYFACMHEGGWGEGTMKGGGWRGAGKEGRTEGDGERG